MRRSMIMTRLQAKRRKTERDERVRIQFNSAMDKLNEIEQICKQNVDFDLNWIRARTDEQILQMKWSDLMKYINKN